MYEAIHGFKFDTKEKVEAFNKYGQFCFSGYDKSNIACKDDCVLNKECEVCYKEESKEDFERMEEVKQTTIGFYNWLIEMDYTTEQDMAEDIDDMIVDFNVMKEEVPRMYNLIKSIFTL